MTIDGSPPSKSDVARDELNVTVPLDEVLEYLTDTGILSENCFKENEGAGEVGYEEFRQAVFNRVLSVVKREASSTEAWNNGRHGMDPKHRGEMVDEVLDDYELEEIAGFKTQDLMGEVAENVGSDNVFEDKFMRFTIVDFDKKHE